MARLIMAPAPGERLLRFVGDRIRFSLRTAEGSPLPEGWRVLLRTTIGRAKLLRQEIISAYPRLPTLANYTPDFIFRTDDIWIWIVEAKGCMGAWA